MDNRTALHLSPLDQDEPVINILLVDDQSFILELLQSYLAPQRELNIVGTAKSGEEALTLITSLLPDIVLTDIEMQGMDGLMLTEAVQRMSHDIKVIILSSHEKEDYIYRAISAGAQGYFLKDTPAPELIHAIRFVQRGYLQLGPGLFQKIDIDVRAHPPSDTAIVPPPIELEKTIVSQNGDVSFGNTDEGWSAVTQKNLDTLPRVWTRGLLYFLIAFIAIALPWALLFEVDETSIARGRLEPKGATIRLDAKNAGVVSTVRVKEGQTVQKGQILLELDSAILQTELQQAKVKLSGQLNQLSQTQLVKSQLSNAITIQSQQNQAQRTEKKAQVAQAKQTLEANKNNAPLQDAEKLADVEKAEARFSEATKTLVVTRQRHQNNLAEVERYQKLQQEGIIAEIQVVEVKQQANSSQNALIRAEGAVQDAKKQLEQQRKTYALLQQKMRAEQIQSELRLQEQLGNEQSLAQGGNLALSQSQQQFDELQSQMSALQSDIQQTQSQIRSLNLQLEQRVLRSPTDGVIFQLPIQKAQTFVQQGQLVAHIAPKGLPLVLKAQASSQQSGQMKAGMPVKLKFDAYPFQDYGVVPGHLYWISPDSKTVDLATEQGQAEMFELEVELQQTYIRNKNEKIPLTPGQTATAEAIIRRRRIIDFILDPLRQLQKGGLKL